MSIPQTASTPWGYWFIRLTSLPDAELDLLDIGDLNLRCAWDLPENVEHLHNDCLELLNEWAEQLRQFTGSLFYRFQQSPDEYYDCEAAFRALLMVSFVQRQLGVQYNFAFLEGEYDTTDSRNNFIGGVLTGFGGTCASLPILYAALGERVGYPIRVCSTWEHFYCYWENVEGDGFCFDAAGNGFEPRSHDFYRNLRRSMSDADQKANAFLRPLTKRELIAEFAAQRARCLEEHLRFDEALEASLLASRTSPQIQNLAVGGACCNYTRQLFRSLDDRMRTWTLEEIESVVNAKSFLLDGSDAMRFRSMAVDNLMRIFRNRIKNKVNASSDQALLEFDYFTDAN